MQTARVIELNAPTFEASDLDPATAQAWLANGEAVLVDVREFPEYEAERIPGAMLVPLSFFDAEAFPRIGKPVIVTCAVGKRSAAAAKQLLKAGHTAVFNLSGGLQRWKAEGLGVER